MKRRSQGDVSETNVMSSRVADARFEAIVLVIDDAGLAGELRPALAALLEAGASVAVVTRTPRHEVWESLAAADGQAGMLLLADCRSPRLTVADGSGTLDVLETAGEIDSAAVARAVELTVTSLAALGLEARAVAAIGSPVVAFDLFGDDGSAETVDEVLFAHGIAPDVVGEVVRAAARESGIVDARVCIDRRQVVLALGDEGDALDAVFGELWRHGIAAREVVVLVDGADRSWARLLVPASDVATVLAVDAVDHVVPAGVGRVDGWDRGKHVLDDQLARRRAILLVAVQF